MEPTEVVYNTCRHYLSDSAPILGPELTNRIQGYLRSRSLANLTGVSAWFDPEFHGHAQLRCLLQIEALFKKCDLFSSENCKEVAHESFLESERICAVTNLRLDDFYKRDHDWISNVVNRTASIIEDVLGPRSLFLEVLPSLIRSTNGATATHPRSRSGGAARLKRTLYATERSHVYLKALAKSWGYKINFRKIHHNRVELVPKNWKTHRTIACEPEGNIALQLAFDAYCKRKLRSRLNIDLSDQSLNQRLAEEASVHGKLCTVDLTAASDRLSLNVVHLLFPREWVDYFLDTRSPCWKDAEGNFIPYAKLSSMGNGYTFTIETLVFGAVCKALGSRRYSVYGDDIIIETKLYDDLAAVLSYLGFEVNKEKSHHDYISDKIQSRLGSAPLLGSMGNLARRLRETEGANADYPKVDPEFEGRLSDGRIRRDMVSWLSNVIEECIDEDNSSRGLGVYRESCGVHYFGGKLVTPLFIRSLRTRRDWVLLINNMMSFGAMGGAVWEYATEIIQKLKLPLGPPILDTSAYVFIDVHTSYRLGLIRSFRNGKGFGPWQPAVRALVERARTVECWDSRALFLWFLHRKERPYESTRHSQGTYKCRSKWVRYRPVMADLMGGSVRLHWWTELLLARKG